MGGALSGGLGSCLSGTSPGGGSSSSGRVLISKQNGKPSTWQSITIGDGFTDSLTVLGYEIIGRITPDGGSFDLSLSLSGGVNAWQQVRIDATNVSVTTNTLSNQSGARITGIDSFFRAHFPAVRRGTNAQQMWSHVFVDVYRLSGGVPIYERIASVLRSPAFPGTLDFLVTNETATDGQLLVYKELA